jgi:transcription elongation factor Elf1
MTEQYCKFNFVELLTFAHLLPQRKSRQSSRSVKMITRLQFVTKRLTCPGCGAENRVRFEASEMLHELPCSHCAAIVWWKRRPYPQGSGVQTAFSDYESEIAPRH